MNASVCLASLVSKVLCRNVSKTAQEILESTVIVVVRLYANDTTYSFPG